MNHSYANPTNDDAMSGKEELLSPRDQRFLILSNYLIGITVFLDLMHITAILVMPLELFTLFNLIVLTIAVLNYRIKKGYNERLASNES